MSVHVEGLFGDETPRHIDLRTRDRVTILTGPNGRGKTRLLNILRAVLAFDWEALAREPFDKVTVAFSSKRSLRIARTADDVDSVSLIVEVAAGKDDGASCSIYLASDPTSSLQLPSWIQRVADDLWEDTRDGEILELEELYSRFPTRAPRRELTIGYRVAREEPLNGVQALRTALGRCPVPTFVRTQRLDVEQGRRIHARGPMRRRGRIHEYVEEIQAQVEVAQSEYSKISQRADSQFASRALDKSGADPPPIGELRLQFDELAALHRELLSTGLVAETPGVEMGEGTLTAPERRFLAVFLDGWRSKLQPLVPVHEKLQMLQEIVGEKFDRKRLRLDGESRLRIQSSPRGTPIPVDQLSSGEQHLLALFAMLLFNAATGSVVLIDEPEISLHAEWKHAFLDDIRRVAEAADLHIVLATHSTGIINGQWDLVEQL